MEHNSANPYNLFILNSLPFLRGLRRDLHRHPELSNREVRTAGIVAERLRALGFDEVKTGVAHHGVVGILHGAKPGRVVAVRADMDALPIQEPPDRPYASTVPGVMHACGHDVHTTVGLGTAEVLAGLRGEFAGTVKFLFQPCEEGPPAGEEGGALLMVKEGALENPRPEAVFGLHCFPQLPVGTIGYNFKEMLSSSDRFVLRVKGKKTHGAYPHRGIDAVVVASSAVMMLQTIRSRFIDQQQPVVMTIGSIHGGNRHNIVADEVVMEGTVRALDETVRQETERLIKQILHGVAESSGAECHVEYERSVPATINDPELVERMLPSLIREFGEEKVVRHGPRMGAEDFSFFANEVPGMFFSLGVANPEKGIVAGIHTPEFDVDEDCLPVGVRAMTALVLDFLKQ